MKYNKKFDTMREIFNQVDFIFKYHSLPLNELSQFNTRLVLFRTSELFKTNKVIVRENPTVYKFIDVLLDKLTLEIEVNNLPIQEYVEDFRRKCDDRYRAKARKKVYSFYIVHIEELCFDVIEKILSFI
jgi:hypothetical protein